MFLLAPVLTKCYMDIKTEPYNKTHSGGSVLKIKQKPVTVGDRNTYGTLSPERTPFQNGINGKSHMRKVLREICISHTYPM
jgi:hypothetical protein